MLSRATAHRLVNGALTFGVNRYLQLDPACLARAAKLDQRTLAIRVQGLGVEMMVQVQGERLCFVQDIDDEPDTRLSGPPFSLVRMLRSDGTRALFSGDVTIEGDTEIAKRFKRLFDTADIDWEEQLSQLLGDYPARKLLRAMDALLAWQRRSRDSLRSDMSDYLREETDTLVPGYPAADWYDEVDRLRDDVERLAARLERLERGSRSAQR